MTMMVQVFSNMPVTVRLGLSLFIAYFTNLDVISMLFI